MVITREKGSTVQAFRGTVWEKEIHAVGEKASPPVTQVQNDQSRKKKGSFNF